MTQDKLIKLARKVDTSSFEFPWDNVVWEVEQLQAFANLIRKEQIEIDAVICEAYDDKIERMRDSQYQAELSGRQIGAYRCAEAIRNQEVK